MFSKLSKISWKFRIIFEVLVIAIVVALIYFFAYTPKVDQITDLQKKVDRLSLRVAKLKPVKANYKRFKKEFELLNKQFKTVLQILPNERNYNVLYDEVVGLAERNGVKITLFQPKGEKKIDSFHSSVNFNIKMETSYKELINYLYRLNYINKIVNINNFNIKPKADKEGNIVLNVDTTMNSYRFNVAKTAGVSK
jgi:type IV pilus assembly protein PilO